MPVAKMLWQAAPFATVLYHIQQSIEQLQIGHAHIPALPRQTISDALKLTLCDFHAPKECRQNSKCQLVLTGPRIFRRVLVVCSICMLYSVLIVSGDPEQLSTQHTTTGNLTDILNPASSSNDFEAALKTI